MRLNTTNSFSKLLTLLVAAGWVGALVSNLDAKQVKRIVNEHFEMTPRLAQDFYQDTTGNNSPFSAQPKYKTVATALRVFNVPFQINAADDSFIEVQLYVSRDMGKTWSFHSRQSTDQAEFPFEADSDGEYWFALKTLNRDRKLIPEGDPQIDLKIVVDSVKPELDFRIETDAAGRVACRWKATDENIAPQSLRILYQPVGVEGQLGDWTEVPVKLNSMARAGVYADQLAWWPETTEQLLNVAIEIKDVAGNAVQLDRQVRIAQSGWRNQPVSTARPVNQVSRHMGAWSAKSNQANQVSGPTETAKASNHPPGMVCKDGICTFADPDQKEQAAQSPTQNLSAQLVKGELGIDYSEPPVPDGYDPSENVAENWNLSRRPQSQGPLTVNNPHIHTNGTTDQKSQVWPSETSHRNLDTQTSISSTTRPDPRLAPDPYPNNVNPRPVTDVPSNAPTMVHRGDQVIGESSTKGASNQYRGMNEQQGRKIAKPTLMPGVEGLADNWNLGSPGNRGNESFQANNSFRNAGFTNPQQPTPARPQLEKEPTAATQRALRPIMPTRPTKAPLQIIGSKRFRLNYGIDSIDPSGVAKVDLWQTRDGGRTWSVWGSDPDNQSPFPVQVQEEGRYGFRVVVHSKDGLTGQGPSSGDDPDMWILVDTQSPLTRISSVPYGRGKEAGRLVINYSVADKHLTLRPIALAYSSSPEGPWETIGTGLRNEGRFVWKPTPNIPDRIFLRIDALDKAGNVGVHMLSQAIDVSGLVPRGTIHGVTPVGERSPRNQ